MPTYIQKEDASVHTPFADGNRIISPGTGADSFFPVTPTPSGGTETHGFMTIGRIPNRLPNSSLWESGGTQTFQLNLDFTDALITVSCRVVRLDSNGIVLQSGSFTSPIACSTNRTLSPVSPVLWTSIEEACSNLLAFELLFTNNNSEEGHGVVVAVGESGDDVVTDITEDNNGCTNPVSGAISGTSSFSADIAALGALAGAISGTSTFSGDIGGIGELIGAISGDSSFVGAITGKGALVGAIAGASSFSGIITGAGVLAGSIEGTSVFAGNINGIGSLSGAIAGSSTLNGIILGRGQLRGAIEGGSLLSGVLVGNGALIGAIEGTSVFAGKIRRGPPFLYTITLQSGIVTQIDIESSVTDSITLKSGMVDQVDLESELQ